MRSEKKNLRPGELARMMGVSTDTLRHYERLGLLKPLRAENGYREYPPEAQNRVRVVRRALSMGFTLEELARLMRVRDDGGAPCRQARRIAAAKLEDLERRLQELILLRGELKSMLEDWDARLARTAEGERACLLESLCHENLENGEGRR